MNNENQDQKNQQLDKKTPDDLLVLVNRPKPLNLDNSSIIHANSENNKFIKDSPVLSAKTSSNNNITNDKLNSLLGVGSIQASSTLINNSNANNNNNNNNNLVTSPSIVNQSNNINNQGIVEEKKEVIEASKKLVDITQTIPKKIDSVSGSGMNIDTLMKNTYNYKIEIERKTIKSNKLFLIAAIGSAVCFFIVLMFALFSGGINFSFIGEDAYYEDKSLVKTSEFQTSVVTDNEYKNVTINGEKDAEALIIKDSNNQKNKCENSKIKEIETRIEEKYDITAVNFCEMDYKFALEIEKVLDKIHKEFPEAIKGHLTNLTLANYANNGVIASFTSAKKFASANTFNTYPNVYKTSIFLNAEYFLNLDRFDVEMQQMSGDFYVDNASSSSVVAHEFGHYLSFVAQLKNSNNINSVLLLTRKNYRNYSNLITDSNEGVFSKKILDEAYENFSKKSPGVYGDLYDFRESISGYAVDSDENGNTIYDETIAEAFHDWYLNKQNAAEASKEIVSVLKNYLNK